MHLPTCLAECGNSSVIRKIFFCEEVWTNKQTEIISFFGSKGTMDLRLVDYVNNAYIFNFVETYFLAQIRIRAFSA